MSFEHIKSMYDEINHQFDEINRRVQQNTNKEDDSSLEIDIETTKD